MTLEEEIKRLVRGHGAEVVGIASVADINRYAPPGYRPDDILIGAKSVITFAGQIAIRGAWRSPDYRTHYHNRDRSSVGIAMALAKFIESKYGYYSLPEVPPPVGFNPSLSMKLCAEMAGLGTRSMAAGIILNQKLGMISISICLTTMPLIADGAMKELVCPHHSCLKLWERRQTVPCLEACPECLSGELEGGRIKWMRYDRRICSTRAQSFGRGSFQRILLEGANEPNPEVRRSILLGSFYRQVVAAVTSGAVVAQCVECTRNCPVCLQARSLKVKSPEPTAASA